MDEACAVCLTENAIAFEHPSAAECGVKVCRECAVQWFKLSNNCPSCLEPLRASEIEYLFEDCCRACGSQQHLVTIDCAFKHMICATCLLLKWTNDCKSNRIPTCAGYQNCKHTLTIEEIQDVCIRLFCCDGLLEDTKTDIMQLSRNLVPSAFALQSSKTLFQKKCPKKSCKGLIHLPDQYFSTEKKQVKYLCPSCRLPVCSYCWTIHTDKWSCKEAEVCRQKWQNFVLTANELKIAEKVKETFLFNKQIQENEEQITKTCVRCPYCKKGPIYKIDGCSVMTCGKDAEDKGSRNRYTGCGKTFGWKKIVKVNGSFFKASLPYVTTINQKEMPTFSKEVVMKNGIHPLSNCFYKHSNFFGQYPPFQLNTVYDVHIFTRSKESFPFFGKYKRTNLILNRKPVWCKEDDTDSSKNHVLYWFESRGTWCVSKRHEVNAFVLVKFRSSEQHKLTSISEAWVWSYETSSFYSDPDLRLLSESKYKKFMHNKSLRCCALTCTCCKKCVSGSLFVSIVRDNWNFCTRCMQLLLSGVEESTFHKYLDHLSPELQKMVKTGEITKQQADNMTRFRSFCSDFMFFDIVPPKSIRLPRIAATVERVGQERFLLLVCQDGLVLQADRTNIAIVPDKSNLKEIGAVYDGVLNFNMKKLRYNVPFIVSANKLKSTPCEQESMVLHSTFEKLEMLLLTYELNFMKRNWWLLYSLNLGNDILLVDFSYEGVWRIAGPDSFDFSNKTKFGIFCSILDYEKQYVQCKPKKKKWIVGTYSIDASVFCQPTSLTTFSMDDSRFGKEKKVFVSFFCDLPIENFPAFIKIEFGKGITLLEKLCCSEAQMGKPSMFEAEKTLIFYMLYRNCYVF